MNAPEASRATMNKKPVFTVPAKTIINFESGFKDKQLCTGPTFSAGTSCPYSCSFCYVTDQMRKQMPWLREHGVVGNHEDVVIRRANPVEIVERQLKSKPEAFRRAPGVIYSSPLTDVAANMELVKETIEICKMILNLTDWDIRLLSKSNLLPKVAEGLDYLEGEDEHYNPMRRVIYGVSTGTLVDGIAAAFEEGTPKVSKRIESLHWLQDHDFRTFGMICPSLPQNDAGEYKTFAESAFAAIRAEKCEHVWAEPLNVRGDSMVKTVRLLREGGFNNAGALLEAVSMNSVAWENYARATFTAHAGAGYRSGQLKFLQYVNNGNIEWWRGNVERGAVLLGAITHEGN